MKVKALTEIKDVNQTPEPDGTGGFNLVSHLTHLQPGEVVELPDEQAARLIALGYVSEDEDAPLVTRNENDELVAR